MANTALYFRFLGFEVLMPDLLGHGESDGPLGFGIKDSQLLNELLDNRAHDRLYVLGNSMGAVAAAHLAATRKDIAGLILQAPVPEFGLAAVRYIESYSPLLAACLSDRAIEDGALQALRRAGVDVAQTDIKPLLSTLSVPVLILASPDDPVAPPK